MPSFTFPVVGHTVFVVQPVSGAYDTFCIYFNFKIVLNKFIRLADKLKTTYSLVGTGDLAPVLFAILASKLYVFETAHGTII